MRKTFLIFLIIPLFSFAQVKTTWKDARFMKDPLQKILVVSQFYDQQLRDNVERNVIDALQDKGVAAVAASDVFMYDSTYLYSTCERKLDSAGLDGLLFIKMVDVRGTDMYIMPQELIPPFAYNYYEYYSFYYYHDLPIISDPNYYRKPGMTFRIDVNLYQNKGDMIIWGGQTKTLDPLEPEKVVKSLGKKLVKKMLSEKVVSPE